MTDDGVEALPVVRHWVQHICDDCLEARIIVELLARDGLVVGATDGRVQFRYGAAHERQTQHGQLIENHAQRPNVALIIERMVVE